jgi:tetratricopeptide (TPR) repeat protein
LSRRWLTLVAAIVAAGILPFVALEAGLRIFHYGYPTDFFIPIEGRQAYASNERFGWRFFPPSIARAPVVSLIPDQKGPHDYRIFILGDSTAMGTPDPAFGFGRMLGAMLERRYPNKRFQIINTAMTAINSHVMVSIAADCARHQPDLFIVLAGNNEVIGPCGPGTVLGSYAAARPLIRTAVWFKSTRTAQLLEQQMARFRSGKPLEWQGMALFTSNRVTFDDPRLASVYQNFQKNVEDIAGIARGAGARLILCTMPGNAKTIAPFASIHRAGLGAQERAQWQRLYDGAVGEAKAGQYEAAVEKFRDAAKLDDHYADLHYRLARCLAVLGWTAEADEHFSRALDLDALRFRADSRINDAIRKAAAQTHAELADVAPEISAQAAGLFYEHVHLNFEGNYRLASLLLPRVEAGGQNVPPATEAEVADALVYTDWHRDRSEMEMARMMLDPPFTEQLDFAERKPVLEERLATLTQKWALAGTIETMRQDYARYVNFLAQHSDDLYVREHFVELLSSSSNWAAAIEQCRALIERVPIVARWHAELAHELAEAGQLANARAEAETALSLDPQIAESHFTIGFVMERAGQKAEAAAEYVAALRIKPHYPEAHLRLAIMAGREGRYAEAVEHYAEFLQRAPGSAEIENNMAFALSKTGDLQGAASHYREALRLKPEFAEAWNNLGAVLERLGQTGEAIADYRKALELRPGFPEAQRHLNEALRLQ